MNQPVLEFKNVTWTYEDMDHPALRDVSFTVDRGELVGIVGVNDAGKSTLCRLCNGLIPHSFIGQLTGDVLVNGQSIRDMETAALARSVGSVFSDPEAQMSQVTVLDELYFGPANLNRPKEEILAAAQSVMELLGLAKFRDRSPFQLSGGEQQRVAIASVLTMQPEILALDEPTSNLDPISTERIFQVIAQLNREMGTTVLLVEHEIELLAQYATRILVVHDGAILLDGTPQEVFSRRDIFDGIGLEAPRSHRSPPAPVRNTAFGPANPSLSQWNSSAAASAETRAEMRIEYGTLYLCTEGHSGSHPRF